MSTNMLRGISIQGEINLALVTAACEFRGSLCLGLTIPTSGNDTEGRIIPLDFDQNSNSIPFKMPKTIPNPHPHCAINALYSIKEKPQWLFIHEALPNNLTGTRILYNKCGYVLPQEKKDSEETPEQTLAPVKYDPSEDIELCPNANLFAISKDPRSPTMVTATKNKFTIYRFNDDNKPETIVPLIRDKDAGGEIKAIQINSSAVLFFANSKYRAFWYTTSGTPITEVASAFIEHPKILSFPSVNFLVCLTDIMFITGARGAKPSSSIQFDQGIDPKTIPPSTGETSKQPKSLFYYQGKIIEFFNGYTTQATLSYDNTNEPFRVLKAPNVRCACEVNDTLIMLSEIGLLAYGGTSKGVQLATNAMDPKTGLDTAIDQLSFEIGRKNPDAPDIIADMFKTIWEHEKYNEAMTILTKVIWPFDCREVLSLYPCFLLANPLESHEKLGGLKVRESPSKEELSIVGTYIYTNAIYYRKRNDPNEASQISVLDSCLFQFYAMTHRTRELDDLLTRQNSVDVQLVQQFFAKNLKKARLHPALAVYYTRTDKVPEALTLWKSLNDHSKPNEVRWATEASFTLREVKVEKMLDDNLKWISERSKEAAVNALLYPSVDPGYAYPWIETHCREYLIKFLDFITKQTDPLPKPDLVNKAILLFCKILKDLEQPDVDFSVLTFSEKAMDYVQECGGRSKANPDLAEEVAEEICRRVTEIIRDPNNKNLDRKPYVDLVKQTKHRALLFELYSTGEMYQEAINLVFKSSKIDTNELENFCRGAPHPDQAFTCAFRKLSSTHDIVADFQEFLINNLEWVDLNEMVEWIPEKAKLKSVDLLINTAANMLIEKQRIAQLRLDIVQSMKVDVDYRLVKAQLRNAEVQHNTLCNSCNRPVGNGYLAIAPDNRVYHLTCKPDLDLK